MKIGEIWESKDKEVIIKLLHYDFEDSSYIVEYLEDLPTTGILDSEEIFDFFVKIS